MAWRRARTDTGGGVHFAEDLDAIAQGCAAALQIDGVLVTSIEGERQRVLGVHGLPGHVLRGALLVPANPSCRVVAATGKPRLVQDGRARRVDDPARLGAVAYAGMPVATHAVVAPVVLAAIAGAPRAWCERDVSVLRGFAAIAASTLDGQALQRRCAQLEREREEAELMLAMATLGGSATLGTALSRLARHVGWVGVEALLIDGDHLRSHGAHVDDLALEPLVAAETRPRDRAPLAAEATQARAPLFDHDVARALGPSRGPLAVALGVHTVAALPILVRHEAIGVLELMSRERSPDVAPLRAMAPRLAAVLGQVLDRRRHLRAADRRTAELEVIAFHDELTGLLNRRGFFAVAESQLARAQRHHGRAVLLFVDLDHLKHVNDAHGHAGGDALIRSAAGVLQATFGDEVVARLGGDEFVALVLTDDPEAERVTERLAAALAHARATDPAVATLAWSVGAAAFDPAAPCSLDQLLGRADAQMYAAKRSHCRGGDRG
ncbi:MAG: GGDEF domain-containing protein [Myxococcales bacterium]|nr:GGDEF domain-containing protein [Myxococcales bacterium]